MILRPKSPHKKKLCIHIKQLADPFTAKFRLNDTSALLINSHSIVKRRLSVRRRFNNVYCPPKAGSLEHRMSIDLYADC
jgi:hypothetical protein